MKKLLSTIFSGLLLLAASAVRAQGSAQVQGSVQLQDSVQAQGSATIKYLGAQDDQVIFHIAYANPQGSPFNLVLRDQDGLELYQHSFHDRSFSKQFRLPRTNKGRLSFIIRSGRDIEIIKNFEIDTRMTEDVVVTQLK